MNWSSRALECLKNPQFSLPESSELRGGCQWNDTRGVAWDGSATCERWGYWGDWSEGERALLEAFGRILRGKAWGKAQEIGLRETEAYLRDRNSQPALPVESYQRLALVWEELQQRVSRWSSGSRSFVEYRFPSEKAFKTLSLPEKIHELKAFFSSERMSGFYRQQGRIEVLDVEDVTVFIALDGGGIPEAPLLDWLQMTLAETFREPALNLIPERFPS